ncbi:phage scaffolding protein [Muricomes intestini]|jgi:hypothetical protein|uniref:phage scaffolding protein n=1 Tax=Muricomes intestini TaxID=1796634 RepID=UPI002FE1C72C
MEFLKEILGDELYSKFKEKVDAYNGDEANKDKQIKLANLTGGEYVSKDKYSSLETDMTSKGDELDKANKLIEELKKSTGKDQEAQEKITGYEEEITKLKAENETLKTDNALKFALKDAGAVDTDYLVYKAKEKGDIKLDDKGNVAGIDDLISGLKTQIPTMFESKKSTKIDEQKLPEGNNNQAMTKEELLKKPYNDILQYKTEHEDEYKTIMKGE